MVKKKKDELVTVSAIPEPTPMFSEAEASAPITAKVEPQEIIDLKVCLKIKGILDSKFKTAMIEIGNLIIDNGYLSKPKSGNIYLEWGPKKTYRQLVERPEFPMTKTAAWNCVTVSRMMKFLAIEDKVETDHLTFSHLLIIASSIKDRKEQVARIKGLKENPMSVHELEASLKPTKTIAAPRANAFSEIAKIASTFSEAFMETVAAQDLATLKAAVGAKDEADLDFTLAAYKSSLQRALEVIELLQERIEKEIVPTSEQEPKNG